jgi:organic hydroperoxide reductase OsmC/OhrA
MVAADCAGTRPRMWQSAYNAAPTFPVSFMSSYTATVSWQRNGAAFTDNKYSRAHDWKFDGGAVVRGSSSPHAVRVPYSDESAVDPEEAFVAALSSCHMLWFLSLAARRGFVVDSYEDQAVGTLAKNDAGKLAMSVVTLRPKVVFVGRQPAPAELDSLHHAAHEECFIASSVKSDVRCEPQ